MRIQIRGLRTAAWLLGKPGEDFVEAIGSGGLLSVSLGRFKGPIRLLRVRGLLGLVGRQEKLAGLGGQRELAGFDIGQGELAGGGTLKAGLDLGDRLAGGPAEGEIEQGALGGLLQRLCGRHRADAAPANSCLALGKNRPDSGRRKKFGGQIASN